MPGPRKIVAAFRKVAETYPGKFSARDRAPESDLVRAQADYFPITGPLSICYMNPVADLERKCLEYLNFLSCHVLPVLSPLFG